MKNRHFFRLGTNRATVKGKSEHMLTPKGGGIAERPLTATNTYNIWRSRDIFWCSGCCLQRRVVGGLGAKSPRKHGCRAESPAGGGQSPRFCSSNQEEVAPAVVNFLLIHYAEIFLSRDVPLSLPPLGWAYAHLNPWQYSTFFEIGRQRVNPGF